MKQVLFFSLLLAACSNAKQSDTNQNSAGEQMPAFQSLNLQALYDSAGFKGCFVLYDRNANTYFLFDSLAAQKAHSPASTFKIFNSIAALETGTIQDEKVVFHWDGVKRWVDNWNKNQNLHQAFQNSTVWYYQILARRMGKQRLYHYLDTFAYTNKDTSGPVDMMWLNGKLRVNAMQQVEFLRKFQERKLPIATRTYKIMDHVMIADSNQNYILRAKTGWSEQDTAAVGWYIGYFTTADNVYFFANCLLSEGKTPPHFAQARKEIVYQIMRRLKLIP